MDEAQYQNLDSYHIQITNKQGHKWSVDERNIR